MFSKQKTKASNVTKIDGPFFLPELAGVGVSGVQKKRRKKHKNN